MATPGSGTAGTRLSSAASADFRPLGAFGKPAWQSHTQLRAMLLGRAGPRVANFFSRPAMDGDSGALTWVAEVQGEARTWDQLPQAERASRAMDLEVIRSGLARLAGELREAGGTQAGGAGAYASLLEQAVKVPAKGEHLYFVGDQPVIAFWGFADETGASVEPAARAPEYARLGALPAAPLATPAPVAPPPAKSAGRPWWWWLLALLALLLLLLLLFSLRSCVDWGLNLWRGLPAAPAVVRPPVEPPVVRKPEPPPVQKPEAKAPPAALDERLREAKAGTGDVQISIAWNNVNDIDLVVFVHDVRDGRELSRIWHKARSDRFGGLLDIDQNREGQPLTATPVENIFWPGGRAPAGRYTVVVHHYKNHGAADPTRVQVRILSDGKEQRFQAELREGEHKQVTTFERQGR